MLELLKILEFSTLEYPVTAEKKACPTGTVCSNMEAQSYIAFILQLWGYFIKCLTILWRITTSGQFPPKLVSFFNIPRYYSMPQRVGNHHFIFDIEPCTAPVKLYTCYIGLKQVRHANGSGNFLPLLVGDLELHFLGTLIHISSAGYINLKKKNTRK